MKFAALIGTKDEADVLPLTIEQLRRVGVELIIVMDFSSTDGTPAFLAEAEKAGDVWVIGDHFKDTPDGTGRAVKAALARASEAEWILFLDSDELAVPRTGSLHDLDDLKEHDVLAVPRYNVVVNAHGPHMPAVITPERHEELLLYAQPIPDFYHHMRRYPLTPWIRGVLEPKTLSRTEAVAAMHMGDHDIDATAKRWRRGVAHDLFLAHAPVRSLERFEMRSANYLKEVDAEPEAFLGWSAWQWRLFAEAHRAGHTPEQYERQIVDAGELAALRSGRVVRSAAEVFAEPITTATSDDEWLSLAARAEPWLTATSLVSRRQRIQPGGKLEHLSGLGQYPAVLLPPDHVVKFYAPWRGGHEAAQREAATLELLASHDAVAAPRLVASGELEPDLRYNVMTKMPGVARSQIEYELSSSDRNTVARWVGDFVRRLHDVPLSDADRARAWERFAEVARERYGQLQQLAVDRGFSAALVERLADWLPSIDELVGTPGDAVLGHGALGASSLMGQPAEPSFVPTGVVDLSRSFAGPPLADFGAIWWSILERDPDALGAFLETSGLHTQTPDFERNALAWALMTPLSTTPEIGDAGGIDDPDELARLWFGDASMTADSRDGDLPDTEPGPGTALAELAAMDESEHRYEGRRSEPWPWNEVAELICTQIGVQSRGPVTRAPHGTHPAIVVPPDHIIKLYPRWAGGHALSGHELHARESAALRLLERDDALAVPRIVADGTIAESWRYLMLRLIPGTPLHDLPYEVDASSLADLADWLGRFVRRLHATPLSDSERASGWFRFKAEIDYRRRSAAERLGGAGGMPAHLAAQLDDWLPSLHDLVGGPEEAVLSHADLSPAHIVGEMEAGHFRPTGVIDLANAQIGQPLFELGPIWWHTLRTDPGLLRTFLDAAQLPGYGQPGFARRALVWAILNPRWGWADLPGTGEVDNLDELADAAFQGLAGSESSRSVPPNFSAPAALSDDAVIEQLESLARSEEAYRSARRAREPWSSAAAIACDRHGLGSKGPLQPVRSGSRPAIRVSNEYLIKLYGPWDWGEILFDREVQALRRLDEDPELPATRLVAAGRLSEHWRYAILSWLDGERLKDVEEGLWTADPSGLVTWLGRFVRALQALPLDPLEQAAGLVDHHDILAYRHREAARRAGERNLLPPHLLAQVDAWLPPLEALIDDSPGAVLVHADVAPSNIIGSVGTSGFVPTRVIDFNQSVVAHALYELGPIWWTILEGDPRRTQVFLSEAQLPGMPGDISPQHALAWAVLNPAWRPQPFAWLDSVRSLDDVATRAFGGTSGDTADG